MTTQAARNLKLSHGGLASANGSVAATPSPAASSSHRSSISTSHAYFLDSNYAGNHHNHNNGYSTSAATSPLSFTFQVPMVGTPSSGHAGTSTQQKQQSGLVAAMSGSHQSSSSSSLMVPQQQQQQIPLPSSSALAPYSYNLQPDNLKTQQGLENPSKSTFQATGIYYPTECQNFASEQNINRVSLQVVQQQQEEEERIHTSHLQQDTTPSCGNFKPFKHASLLPTTQFHNATPLGTTQQNSPSQDTTRHQNNPQDQHQHQECHQNQIPPSGTHHHHRQKQNPNLYHHHQHHQNQHHPQPTSNYYNNSPAAPSIGSGFLQLTPEDTYLEASRAAASSFSNNNNSNNNYYTQNNNDNSNTINTASTPASSSALKMPLVIQPQPTLSSLLLPPLALNPVFHHQHHHHHHQAMMHQQLPPLPPRQRKSPVVHLKLSRANVAAIDSKDSRQARWHRVLSYVAQVRSSFAQGEISGSNSPTAAWISHQERIVKSSPDDDLIDAMMDPLWATQPMKRQRSLWDGGSCGTDGVDQFVWDDELDSGGNRFTLPPRSQQGDANEGRVGGESPVAFPLEECPTSSSTGSRRRAMELDQDGEDSGEQHRPSKRARSSEGLTMTINNNTTNNNATTTNTLKVSNANISKTHALALEQYLETLRTIEKSRLPLMKRAMDMDYDYSLANAESWRQVYVS